MYITNELSNYLDFTGLPESLKQNLVLTDLETIIYAATFELNSYYFQKYLSNALFDLIELWKNENYSEDLFIMKNFDFIPLVQNDTISYSGQIIFPLFSNNKLEGFAIFFRNKGNYIKSSFKGPNTVRKFIIKLINNT